MVERALGMDRSEIEIDEEATSVERKAEDNKFYGFNHVMLNRYDDGSVYIGKHRDNKENKVCKFLLKPNFVGILTLRRARS